MNTFREVALSVVNAHWRSAGSRIQPIAERFEFEFVPARQAWYLQEDTVTDCHTAQTVLISEADECCACRGLTQHSCEVWSSPRRSGLWCQSCVESDAATCERCGTHFSDGDDFQEREGDWVCQSCAETIDENECRALSSYHNGFRWGRPSSIPFHSPAYSMEWEIEAEDRASVIKALSSEDFPKISWERDGSLDAGKGLEILIQWSPDLLDLHSRVAAVAKVLRRFDCDSWDNQRCGIHVNQCRNHLPRKAVQRLLYCVLKNKGILERIAGRSNTHWAQFPESRRRLLRDWSDGGLGKYCVVRCGADRLEWRIFRGTLKLDRIRLYFDVINVLSGIALDYSITAANLRNRSASALEELHSAFLAARKGAI